MGGWEGEEEDGCLGEKNYTYKMYADLHFTCSYIQ